MRDIRSKPCRKHSPEGSSFQPPLCTWQEEERKEESATMSMRKEQPVTKRVHHRQLGAMKAFLLVQFMILLGTTMQTLKAAEEDIFNSPREGSRTPRRQQQQMQEDEIL